MEVKFFDIQNWNIQPWFNTGGTRAKKYVQSPEGDFYYFKTSMLKPGKDFKYEYWSEVIASQIGFLYGFDMLTYDVAYDGIKLGCISKSMFIPGQEELVEGSKYLQAFDNTFDPSDKKLRKKYSFQLIESTLTVFGYEKNIKDIIEIMVFDALIGNSDRHQENWAFITKLSSLSHGIRDIETLVKEKRIDRIPTFFRNLIIKQFLNKDATDLNQYGKRMKLTINKNPRFSPIYDSGSSLGRELVDEKVESMLRNGQELEAYIYRGECEIHWNNEKLKFFKMIETINQSPYAPVLKATLIRLKAKNNTEKIKTIILNIDDCLPPDLQAYKIPQNRKELLIKLVTLRFEKLMQYLA
jgi:hypothetical protein